jgi:hypothetical protein
MEQLAQGKAAQILADPRGQETAEIGFRVEVLQRRHVSIRERRWHGFGLGGGRGRVLPLGVPFLPGPTLQESLRVRGFFRIAFNRDDSRHSWRLRLRRGSGT